MMNRIETMIVGALGRSGTDQRPGGGNWRRRGGSLEAEAQISLEEPVPLSMSPDTLPQSAQQSIAALVAEVERLRREVDLAHHYENFLGEEADRHPVLPVLNRRAFVRALGQLLLASQRAEVSGSLLYLHIGGIERLRLKCGLAAADAALSALASILRQEFRQTDLIGYLDGGDFAIALALAEPQAAVEKVSIVIKRLGRETVVWQGARFHLIIGSGLVHFQAGLGADELLALADAARRERRT
jgi:GGDEF domain-containing protein